ncbi:MAG: family N-acetyltransferase [Verrucomicrobiales bacterium]|nr:family N-acetyltransferase [Verrucomicrobiales bacterium]
MDWTKGEYTLTDDPARMDVGMVCLLLWDTYWASNRSRDVIEQSTRHSLNFSLFYQGRQVGFGRVISDYTTVSYLCDVVVAPEHRRKGLGKWMLETILKHPRLGTTRVDLFTRDAQAFYGQFGFTKHRFDSMVRYPPGWPGNLAIVKTPTE